MLVAVNVTVNATAAWEAGVELRCLTATPFRFAIWYLIAWHRQDDHGSHNMGGRSPEC